MNCSQVVPIWNRYMLTIEEGAKYFHIGESKLREIVHRNRDADFVFWNNTRPLIKRVRFEQYLDAVNTI